MRVDLASRFSRDHHACEIDFGATAVFKQEQLAVGLLLGRVEVTRH